MTPSPSPTPGRRSLLRGAFAATAAVALGACSANRPTNERPARSTGGTPSIDDRAARRPLLVYFSRAGENYHRGGRIDLEIGNTAVLARMISERSGCDTHEIVAADPYPESYDATVSRNTREQRSDARPQVRGPLPDVSGRDVLLLASPIWNVRPPMIMQTFTDAVDLAGRAVHPVVTYAVSGMGRTEEVYTRACAGATIGRALAVRGEDVADAGPDVDRWLRETGLA